METQHTEGVVEKALAYVKDMFGIQPDDQTPEVEAKPEYTDTAPERASDDAMRLVSMIAFSDVVRSEVFDGLPGSASRAL
jgi:hypothetical protein